MPLWVWEFTDYHDSLKVVNIREAISKGCLLVVCLLGIHGYMYILHIYISTLIEEYMAQSRCFLVYMGPLLTYLFGAVPCIFAMRYVYLHIHQP